MNRVGFLSLLLLLGCGGDGDDHFEDRSVTVINDSFNQDCFADQSVALAEEVEEFNEDFADDAVSPGLVVDFADPQQGPVLRFQCVQDQGGPNVSGTEVNIEAAIEQANLERLSTFLATGHWVYHSPDAGDELE